MTDQMSELFARTPRPENTSLRCEQCGAPLSSSSAEGCLNCLLLGGPEESNPRSRRFQHYEICLREDGIAFDELGRGAMGVTYRAQDLNLGALVALKVIQASFSANAGTRERFRREACAAAQLRHPNVATVFYYGETASGQCFYAMELVEGETLEARIRREGPMPATLALEVAIQVATALLAAEAHRLVHRDLKPSNLMVVANDSSEPDRVVVKVIDFGLAKVAIVNPADATQTSENFSGTPDFASPEQFSAGQASLDIRSDIYSLGATLWYLLCGSAPFEDRSPIKARLGRLPSEQLSAAHVPWPVIVLLRTMLAPDPQERPQSARELLTALERCREIIANPSFVFR